MHPTVMLTLLVGLLAAFTYSANHRWQLLKIGAGSPLDRLDRPVERLKMLVRFGLLQRRLRYYPVAGLGHVLIFFGFFVLLLRSLILWGRGFDPAFNFWIFGPEGAAGIPLGPLYDFVKDVFAVLVLAGCGVFFHYRVIRKEKRMTLSGEALLILLVISTMMLADMLYDGAAQLLHARHLTAACDAARDALCSRVATITAHLGPAQASPAATTQPIAWSPWPTPAGSAFAAMLGGMGPEALVVLAHVGFWAHAALVLVFLNVLPYTKHFHVITSLPNVYMANLDPPGALRPIAADAEALGAEALGDRVMAAFESPDEAEPIGVARIEHLRWKDLLDLYSCTECGRCTDHCPAARTGKKLNPKELTITLRNHLYGRQDELLNRPGGPKGLLPAGAQPPAEPHAPRGTETANDDHAQSRPENPVPDPLVESKPIDLFPTVLDPEVVWACTTCRACEEQCPVLISYVDKIVEMRRNLVLIRAEFPPQLNGPLQGVEVNGNPWNLSRLDRAAWAKGLDVPTMAEHPEAPLLYWVGCAASYDNRGKKIARAMSRLLKAAQVDFGILGEEESCTGDFARRAGDEYRFAMMAEMNVATLNGYKDKGGVRTVVAPCPHCYNTLKNEYPAFGGEYDVVHHSELLLRLVDQGRLRPTRALQATVAFHDPCYLGRGNQIYGPPRDLLARIPGLDVCEVEGFSRDRGLCCGGGGGQMFMEEQNKDRMNVARTRQLLATGADTIASSCPFCVTMLTDGLKDQGKEDEIQELDIAELLAQSCDLTD